ncbi:hypothetical protein PHMEG_0008113 [Phytophthora megakarya]|uniref:Uncharacterized protein n=1 Tax=Phytophthora megakarya TaxID=4795 RepID=A0A225WJK9_9STRA|nr:hypothetical protein PHMEG_0008113 [Phytophthora megakarya]
MWTAFEQDKTKHDFANSIRICRKLYELEDYRRLLENINMRIDDAEMVNIVLTAVGGSHRNCVKRFIE